MVTQKVFLHVNIMTFNLGPLVCYNACVGICGAERGFPVFPSLVEYPV